MAKRGIVLLFTLLVAVPVWAQSFYFVCGNKDHAPSHWASTLDGARALTKRHGCSNWGLRSGYSGNSMPAGSGLAARLEQMKRSGKGDELTQLNEFSKATVGAIARTQLRPENLQRQPFKIAVTSTQVGANFKNFRITVSSGPTTPVLHGYVAVPTGASFDNIGADLIGTENFVEISRNLQGGTATYEFLYPPPNTTAKAGSQFILADAPLDRHGTAPKNIYWFYLEDFENR